MFPAWGTTLQLCRGFEPRKNWVLSPIPQETFRDERTIPKSILHRLQIQRCTPEDFASASAYYGACSLLQYSKNHPSHHCTVVTKVDTGSTPHYIFNNNAERLPTVLPCLRRIILSWRRCSGEGFTVIAEFFLRIASETGNSLTRQGITLNCSLKLDSIFIHIAMEHGAGLSWTMNGLIAHYCA